jgi:hypothetical protein
MGLFHTHKWKEIARTYAPSIWECGVTSMSGYTSQYGPHGVTTILWECKDKDCQELRKKVLLGKILK